MEFNKNDLELSYCWSFCYAAYEYYTSLLNGQVKQWHERTASSDSVLNWNPTTRDLSGLVMDVKIVYVSSFVLLIFMHLTHS